MELFVPLVDVNPVGALGEQVDRRGAEEIEILGAEDAVQRRHGPIEQYHQLELAFRAAPQRGSQAREADDHETVGEGEIFVQRSEEHTSELQSLMRISYAVFCLN